MEMMYQICYSAVIILKKVKDDEKKMYQLCCTDGYLNVLNERCCRHDTMLIEEILARSSTAGLDSDEMIECS